jgi:hypothetical protein
LTVSSSSSLLNFCGLGVRPWLLAYRRAAYGVFHRNDFFALDLSIRAGKEAEAAFARLGATEQARLPRLLRELVAPAGDNTKAAGRAAFDIRPVPLADAAYDEASARLVQALVDARIHRSLFYRSLVY